jgi:hypothetical protein
MWPVVLVVASALFLGDVVCRRLLISFDWLPRLGRFFWMQKVTRPADPTPRMERLKQTKASATARFEYARDNLPETMLERANAARSIRRNEPSVSTSNSGTSAPEGAGESPEFTTRLLQAKKRVQGRNQRQR